MCSWANGYPARCGHSGTGHRMGNTGAHQSGLFMPKFTIASGLLEDGDVHQSNTLFKMIGLWLASDPVTEEMGND